MKLNGKRHIWSCLLLCLLAAAGCGTAVRLEAPGAAGVAAQVQQTPSPPRYVVTKTITARKWERIERLSSTYEGFPIEHSRPNGRQTDPEIVAAFGTATPPSHDVLLHFAPGWDRSAGTPVLLVHGVIHEATSSWIEPHGQEGLARTLANDGFRVFALTYAHRHGDNLLRAEQIANALHRVRAVTGVRQVDVVAHSQGTVAVRALASGVRLPWMTPYRQDIRRLVMVAGPHLGLDYTFRHPLVNLGLYPEKDDPLRNAPMSWSRMLVPGRWVDTSEQTLYTDAGNYFPGQAQILYRWDRVYPLPTTEPDWYTTYYGGQGFTSYSSGIDRAIAQGGHFIEELRRHPLDRSLELAVLAGDRPTLTTAFNETSGPSDGLVFVKSATATDDMTAGGARLLAKEVLPLNHMELIYAPQAKAWIRDILRRDP